MNNNLTTRFFEELAHQLAQAKKWLASIPIPTEENRFGSIVSNVNLIQQYWNKTALDEVLHSHEMQDLWISLLDADSFVTIYKQFSKLKSHQLPRQRLKEIVSGPLMPHDETKDGSSIQARNAIYELELAAALQERGVPITRFDDIEFEFDGINVNVQCKRLHSNSQLQYNLERACSQIATRIGSTGKWGLVAIGIDKVSGADKTVWEVPHEAVLIAHASNIVKNFLFSAYRLLRKCVNQVLGIIVHLRYIGRIKNSEDDLLTRGKETALLFSAAAERQLGDIFIEKLRKQINNYAEQKN